MPALLRTVRTDPKASCAEHLSSHFTAFRCTPAKCPPCRACEHGRSSQASPDCALLARQLRRLSGVPVSAGCLSKTSHSIRSRLLHSSSVCKQPGRACRSLLLDPALDFAAILAETARSQVTCDVLANRPMLTSGLHSSPKDSRAAPLQTILTDPLCLGCDCAQVHPEDRAQDGRRHPPVMASREMRHRRHEA